MRNLFAKLWADDAGVVTIEYLVLGVFLAIALIVGVATLSAAINTELAELANTVLTFNSSYSVSGQSSCVAYYHGGGASDTCGTITITLTAPTICNVQDVVCN
jgi:Flp pilus assembly pilin Flp